MDRHVLGLGDQAAVEIADRHREIAARVEDLRIGGAQHRLAHLLDDGMQPMLDHRGDDRIGGVHGHCLVGLAAVTSQIAAVSGTLAPRTWEPSARRIEAATAARVSGGWPAIARLVAPISMVAAT